jgi:catechol 2,3-dioxygenase-like lactoylglutathione lyase family enzyme
MGAEPGEGGPVAFNHVGICVSDLDRARRFYEGVLGFRHWWEMDVPDAACSRLLQLAEPVGSKAVYLVNGRVVIELLYFAGAGIHPSPRRVMNDLGLTHLSVAVDDIGATLVEVTAHGGEILEDTDMGGRAIMIRDPDGQLIELTTFGFHDMRPPWPDPATP